MAGVNEKREINLKDATDRDKRIQGGKLQTDGPFSPFCPPSFVVYGGRHGVLSALASFFLQ
jgi:hypothetical protein